MNIDTSSVTVFEAFVAATARWPDNAFFHAPKSATRAYCDSSVDWRYEQACAEVRQLAAQYAEGGLRPGHRVALILGNRAELFLHFLALNSLRVSIVPLNGEATPQEIAFILGDSEAAAVVALPESDRLLQEA